MLKTRSLFAWAAMACLAMASAAASVVRPVVETVVATARALKNWALDGFKLAAADAEDLKTPAVWFVQAKAFVLRLAKRQRPEVSSSWRMCPST